ncbi:MAG: PD-(D/E)XK nuclease domain-containing protein [Clostridiales bacterium]
MIDYLIEIKIEKFQNCLKSMFSAIPSFPHLPYESYYHSMIYMIMTLLGVKMDLEENTDQGRIDGVIEFDSIIYIIEFKLDKVQDAMKQIEDKKYYERYLKSNKKIILLGIGGFRDKNIEVLSEEIKSK